MWSILLVLLTNSGNETVQTSALLKRCNPITVYEVIYSPTDGITGQLIGNGMKFLIANPPTTPVNLCLTVDLSIPKNREKYDLIDIGFV